MPEEEVSYSLIGQSLLNEEAGQRVVQIHLILQHLKHTHTHTHALYTLTDHKYIQSPTHTHTHYTQSFEGEI